MATQRAMTDTEKWDRAARRALAEGVTILEVWPTLYVAPARSEIGRAYALEHRGPTTDWTCNCKAGEEGKPCKHLAALRMLLAAVSTSDGIPRGLPGTQGPDDARARLEQDLVDLYGPAH